MLARQVSLSLAHLYNEAIAHAHSRARILLKQLLGLQKGSKRHTWRIGLVLRG